MGTSNTHTASSHDAHSTSWRSSSCQSDDDGHGYDGGRSVVKRPSSISPRMITQASPSRHLDDKHHWSKHGTGEAKASSTSSTTGPPGSDHKRPACGLNKQDHRVTLAGTSPDMDHITLASPRSNVALVNYTRDRRLPSSSPIQSGANPHTPGPVVAIPTPAPRNQSSRSRHPHSPPSGVPLQSPSSLTYPPSQHPQVWSHQQQNATSPLSSHANANAQAPTHTTYWPPTFLQRFWTTFKDTLRSLGR